MAQDQGPSLVDAMDTIYRQAVQITVLERKNQSLQDELESLRFQASSRQYRVDNTSNKGDQVGADNLDTSPLAETVSYQYAELQLQLAELISKHEKCQPKIDDAMRRYREAKDRCKQWRTYLEKNEKYARYLRDGNTTSPGSAQGDVREADGDQHNDAGIKIETLHPLRSSDHPVNSATPKHSEVAGLTSPKPSPAPVQVGAQSALHHVTSTQSTADCHSPELEPTLELSSDDGFIPVVVASRSLKRGARGAAGPERASRRIKQEPPCPETIIEINSDDRREVPESIDEGEYDLNGDPLYTPPRRVPHHNTEQLRAASCELARSVPVLTRDVSTRSDGEADLTPSRLSSLAMDLKSRSQHRSSHQPRDVQLQQSNKEPNACGGVLRSLDVNIPTPRRKLYSPKVMDDQHKKNDDILALLSEGGDNVLAAIVDSTPQRRGKDYGLKPTSGADHRLEDLLNKSFHERTPSLSRKALGSVASARKRRPSPHYPTPISGLKRTAPQVKRGVLAKYPEFPRPKEPPPLIDPDDEPLRNRDPKSLNLEDFVVNPKYLNTNFAIADTLRGRDARRNLPTTARADCDGEAFDKIVKFGGTAVTGKTDEQALEVYLGPDWKHALNTLGANRRKEMTMQAHVHLVAIEHGKSRQAFTRRSTPPGYWDTDFPTTQQAAQHHERAEKMARQQIQERWREALREQGRWKFRDE